MGGTGSITSLMLLRFGNGWGGIDFSPTYARVAIPHRQQANPNGVAAYSPRLPYSATLGHGGNRIPTPTGLRPTAQGCRTRLPWVTAGIGFQPQRGSGLQPKVAVLGYLGSRRQ